MKHKGYHRYQKAKLGSKVIWKCSLPGCSHYVFDFSGAINGKISLCHKCDEPFVLNNPKKVKPTCGNCGAAPKTDMSSLIKSLFH